MIQTYDPRRHLAWGAGRSPVVSRNGTAGQPFVQLIKSLDWVRSRHTAIFGGTGTGKTTFIEALLLVDIERRLNGQSDRGFAVVDVIGDLTRNMLCRLAVIRQGLDPERRRLLDRLIHVVDPKANRTTAAYDLFDLKPGETPEQRADEIAAAIQEVEQDNPRITVRVKRTLKHGTLALMVTGRQFRDLPRLFTEPDFRKQVIAESRYPKLQQFFRFQFPKLEQKVLERVESSLNRLDILFDPDIEEFLTGPSTFDLARAMDDGAFVFFKFPRHKLGKEGSYLLAALMMAEMHRAAGQRLKLRNKERKAFSIIADEFQLFASESILNMVEQDRKANIELVMSTQRAKGRPQDQHIRDAARAIANTLISFRVSSADAEILLPDLLSPDLDQVKHTTVRYQKVPGWFGEYTQRVEDPMFRSMDEIYRRELRKLTHLPDRHFWLRVSSEPYSLLVQTPNVKSIEELADPDSMDALLAELIEVSDRRIGRPKYKALPRIDPNAEYMFPDEYDPLGW